MLKSALSVLLTLSFFVAGAQDKSLSDRFKTLLRPGSQLNSTDLFLVKINSTQAFKNEHLKVVRQLDRQHYIVKTNGRLSRKNVIFQLPVNSFWKASDNLLRESGKTTKRNLNVVVVLKPGKGFADLGLESTQLIKADSRKIYLITKSNQLEKILDNPAIIFADFQRTASEETLVNDLDLSVNQVNRVHSLYPSLTGNDITISLKEERYNVNDLDLLGRSITSPLQSTNISSHATIMATLVGGNGNSFIKGLGAAPKVKLTSSDYKNLSPDPASELNALGVSIQNHSYGTGIENYYGIEANEYDQQIFLADTLMHVFSAGNSGTAPPNTGLYAGISNFANLSGTFKQAKNVLVVGGTSNEHVAEALSSAGPAYDGRIKPELMAAGAEGTSGAAALTSGVVSLLQQQYKTQTGVLPSSALIKSVLVNSAEDQGRPFPDFKYGFGNLNAFQSVQTIKENRFKGGVLSSSDQLVFPLTVTDKNAEIKVTLAWNDPAAELNAPRALINDLDLWLMDPDGNKIQPWVLSSYPNVDSLTAPAIRKRDTLNNIEQITVNGSSGNYTIHVSGQRVTGTQSFYISYSVKPAGKFTWTYPLSVDQVLAGEDNYLRWESSIPVEEGKILISYDSGAIWNEISTVGLKTGFLKWNSPDIFAKAILKMSVGGKEYMSEAFSISTPPKLRVGYNCTDGVLLSWPSYTEASSYNLYTIKDNLLQILKTTNDTSILVSRQEISSDFFAISPVHKDGFEGLRSLTINAASQGVGCYVQSLLADVNTKNAVTLTLNLGSNVGLKSIRWEKQAGPDSYSPLGERAIIQALNYSFTDFNPKPGIQYYRAVLITQDGREIISELASVIYLDTYQFTLFPNPASQTFTVLSGTIDEFELNLYNSQGQRVRTELLKNISQSYNIASLENGIYICVISLRGRPLFRSKIIKI